MNYEEELIKNFPDLRKQQKGRQFVWKDKHLKAGFEAFNYIYKRYPVGVEIDKFSYLPSQKYFQKNEKT